MRWPWNENGDFDFVEANSRVDKFLTIILLFQLTLIFNLKFISSFVSQPIININLFPNIIILLDFENAKQVFLNLSIQVRVFVMIWSSNINFCFPLALSYEKYSFNYNMEPHMWCIYKYIFIEKFQYFQP